MKKKLGFLLLLMGLCAILPACSKVPGVPGVSNSPAPGKEITTAQRFTLKNLNGDVVSLDQTLSQNKAVLLNFWATWCGYCVEEMPDLVKVQEKFSSRGFTIVGVDVGESKAQAAIFAEKMKINFPIVLDDNMAVAESYGLVGIPMTYLLDSKGMILGEYHSYSSRLDEDIEKALSA